jgi:hypothetical protein
VEGIATALELGSDAVAAIASPDELDDIMEVLYEDKDPNVQQHFRRIQAMLLGEPPSDVDEGNSDVDEGKDEQVDEDFSFRN